MAKAHDDAFDVSVSGSAEAAEDVVVLRATAIEAVNSTGNGHDPRDSLGPAATPRRFYQVLVYADLQLVGRLVRRDGDRRAFLVEVRRGLPGQVTADPTCGEPALPRPLSDSEARVLRCLQTNLTGPEIARELFLSANTVKTHIRHLYDKLGAHSRNDAIERARRLGLLPSPISKRAS